MIFSNVAAISKMSHFYLEEVVIRWHHRLDGHKFEQALGLGDR